VVSDSFTGMTRVQRAQAINKLLAPQYEKGLHALSQQSYTSLEWQKFASKLDHDSPPCSGGPQDKVIKKD
jgi:BolA protein